MTLLFLFYLAIIGVLFICAIALLGSMRAEAPFVPTGRRDMHRILEAARIVPGETMYDLGSGDGRFVRAASRLGARAVGFEQSRILVWWSRAVAWGAQCACRQCGRQYKGPLPSLRNLGTKEINCAEDCRRSQNCLATSPSGTSRLVEERSCGSPRAGYPVAHAIAHGSVAFIRGNYLKENLGEADVIFCYLLPKAMTHLKEKFETELKPGTRIFSRAFKIPGWTPRQRLQFSKHSPPVYVYVR